MPNQSTSKSDYSFSTSISLLNRIQVKEATAWDRFAEIYTPLVLSWVRTAGLQPADAADVVQEVFCMIATKIENFRKEDPDARFRAWLWGITRNVLRQYFRTHGKGPVAKGGSSAQHMIGNAPEFLDAEQAPSSPDEDKALTFRAMMTIKGDFEETTWQAFWLMTIEGKIATEVAQELGMTSNAVRQAKYRVLCRLREEIID